MRWQSKIGYGSMYACCQWLRNRILNNFDVKRKSVKRQHCFIETEHSTVTYRITRTKKLSHCSVAYKTEHHCQHKHKQLTQKQELKAVLAKSAKERRPLKGLLRDKKTACPSDLKLTVKIPTRKQSRQVESKHTS